MFEGDAGDLVMGRDAGNGTIYLLTNPSLRSDKFSGAFLQGTGAISRLWAPVNARGIEPAYLERAVLTMELNIFERTIRCLWTCAKIFVLRTLLAWNV